MFDASCIHLLEPRGNLYADSQHFRNDEERIAAMSGDAAEIGDARDASAAECEMRRQCDVAAAQRVLTSSARRVDRVQGARSTPCARHVVNNAQVLLIAVCFHGNMQANMQADRRHAEQRISVQTLIAVRGETVNAQLAIWGASDQFPQGGQNRLL
jgi:hypothetical protein